MWHLFGLFFFSLCAEGPGTKHLDACPLRKEKNKGKESGLEVGAALEAGRTVHRVL